MGPRHVTPQEAFSFIAPLVHTGRVPVSSIKGRLLEWVAILSSRDLLDPGNKLASLASPALTGGFFTSWATGEAPCPHLAFVPPPIQAGSCPSFFQSDGPQMVSWLLNPLSILFLSSVLLVDHFLFDFTEQLLVSCKNNRILIIKMRYRI